MKKITIVLISLVCLTGLLFLIARVTNVIQYFTVSSGSNEPTLKMGSYCFTSNLVTPKRLDFIAFNTKTADLGPQIWIFRICGMPGDTVLIKDGDLFVNGRALDEGLNLKKLYEVPNALMESIHVNDLEIMAINSDSVRVPLETLKQTALIKKARRVVHLADENPEIERRYGQKWTAHRFGPYVVPAGHYFVMGDNRYLSNDSRYIGPIDAKEVVGTLIQ